MPKPIADTVAAFRESTISVLNSYIKPPFGGVFKPKPNAELHAEKVRLATELRDELQSNNPSMNQTKIMQAVANLIYANKVAVRDAIVKSGVKDIVIGGADEKLPHDEFDTMLMEEVPSRYKFNKDYDYGDLHKKLTHHLAELQKVHPCTLVINDDPKLPTPTADAVSQAKMTRGR